MRRSILLGFAVAIVALAAAGAWLTRHRFAPREVTHGVYRGAQPSPRDLQRAVERHGVRTVLNLRGPNPDEPWYRAEKRAAKKLGLRHADFRLQSFGWPPRIEVTQFARALFTEPRPLLVHCESGLDRSGWAAGIARLAEGESLDAARKEIAPLKGHVCDPKRCGLHLFFDEYEQWLARERRVHSSAVFRHWILEEYCPPPYNAGIAIVGDPPSRAARGSEIPLRVRVTNLSHVPWTLTSRPDKGIRAGARIIGPFDAEPGDALAQFRKPNGPARDLGRAGLENATLAPGSSREFELVVRAPEAAGLYVVQVDMVDEMVHWFSDVGSEGVLFPVVVE
jgi:protein tyrosine phosphatase (PTP) superfamily phosphohydrolase (DUF442 family)